MAVETEAELETRINRDIADNQAMEVSVADVRAVLLNIVDSMGFRTAITEAAIKTLYEGNANTNAFTDSLLTKLGDIESNAKDDQTGPEIVALLEALVGNARLQFSAIRGEVPDGQIPAGIARDTEVAAAYAALAGATFVGATGGIAPVNDSDFVTKGYADANYAGGSTPTAHDLIVGWSADANISNAEITAGASSSTNSVVIPTATGNQHLFVWRADADGGNPTEVHIAGGGNSRNIFGTATARMVGGTEGQLIVSVGTQNAAVLSGETLRVT